MYVDGYNFYYAIKREFRENRLAQFLDDRIGQGVMRLLESYCPPRAPASCPSTIATRSGDPTNGCPLSRR